MRSSLPRFGFAGLLSVVTVIVGFVSAAHADPISDEQAKATAIQDSIEANGERISALSEAYDAAQLRLQQAEQVAATAETQIAADQAQIMLIRSEMQTRGRNLYEQAAGGQSLAVLDVTNAQQVLTGSRYAEAAAREDQRTVNGLNAATADLARTRDEARTAMAAAASDAEMIDQTAQQLEAANQQQYATLTEVQGTLQQLVAQDQARREAQNVATAQSRYGVAPSTSAAGTAPAVHSSNTSSGASSSAPALEAPSHFAASMGSSAAETAIAFARAQLGKPYMYAAAGPTAFDCSGLTMAAWGAAGVELPHYSGAQYAMLPHVSLASMIPGDLIFWGPGGSQHVALYIGGGMMIAAPTTGEDVKIQAIWGHPIGAAQP